MRVKITEFFVRAFICAGLLALGLWISDLIQPFERY